MSYLFLLFTFAIWKHKEMDSTRAKYTREKETIVVVVSFIWSVLFSRSFSVIYGCAVATRMTLYSFSQEFLARKSFTCLWSAISCQRRNTYTRNSFANCIPSGKLEAYFWGPARFHFYEIWHCDRFNLSPKPRLAHVLLQFPSWECRLGHHSSLSLSLKAFSFI